MYKEKLDFGAYIHQLRKEYQYSLKKVAEKLGFDISLLSKIEYGERKVQSQMLKPIAELFSLDFKVLQIKNLNQRFEAEYRNEPFYLEQPNSL